MSSLSVVGKVATRVDGQPKVRGTLQFPSDVYTNDVLSCRCVFAPYPHAKINKIKIDAALAVPGVIRVLTSKDIPGPNVSTYNSDRPILCEDKTRYEGDVVAVVVADSRAERR